MKLYQVQDCRVWGRSFWHASESIEAASPAEAALKWAGRPVVRVTGSERSRADLVVCTELARPTRLYWYNVVADNEAPAPGAPDQTPDQIGDEGEQKERGC